MPSRHQRSILALPRYVRKGASSRLRFFQYMPYLQRNGFDVTTHALLSDRYLTALYDGSQRPVWDVVRSYASRIIELLPRRRFDLLWVQAEMLPWLPAWVETLVRPRGALLVDYDDAIFHKYDKHRSTLVRAALSSKIPRIMRDSNLVVAANPYLSGYARGAGAPRVEILPTVVDLARYEPHAHKCSTPSVVWIGTPVTARYLAPLENTLRDLAAAGSRIRLIGADRRGHDQAFDLQPWTEEAEVEMISFCDIGIMPLPTGDWEQGKSGYKLIQYMAAGLPVVASPVGANRMIVQNGVNGFLAETQEQWTAALRALRDPELRHRMGEAGREKVRREYSLEVAAPRLVSFMEDLIR